jgi:hypothetical protein
MAKPFGVLVCVYCIRPVLKDLFLFLKSHIWHGPKPVTKLGMRKELCSNLPCARVGLCCTLRRIMQSLPELVKQCICISFTKVMVGVHVMFSKLVALLHGSQLCLERLARTGRRRGLYECMCKTIHE